LRVLKLAILAWLITAGAYWYNLIHEPLPEFVRSVRSPPLSKSSIADGGSSRSSKSSSPSNSLWPAYFNSQDNRDAFTRWLQREGRKLPELLHEVGTKNISFQLPPFVHPEPYFVSDGDREFRMGKAYVTEPWDHDARTFIYDDGPHTTVKIYTLNDACWLGSKQFKCGWTNTLEDIFTQVQAPTADAIVHKHLAVAYAPESWSFQHLLRDALPKLALISNLVDSPNTTIFVDRGTNQKKGTLNILDHVGIEKSRRVEPSKLQCAEKLTVACTVPPLHPLMWSRMWSLYRWPSREVPPRERNIVMFPTRNRCAHSNRGEFDCMLRALPLSQRVTNS